jgi:tetratricopeptide (TPR) repeat protein
MRGAIRHATVALSLALLSACATPEPKTPPPPPIDTVGLVAVVRAAAGPADAKDELAIQPLRDPMVEDFRQQAQRYERERRYPEAAAALDEAIAIVGDDPSVLQERAEAALLAGDFDGAERFARRAHEVGAQVGPLCRRHWATIRTVREHHQDAAGTADAQRQFDACKVSAPPRY